MILVDYQVACRNGGWPARGDVQSWVEAALEGERDTAEVVVRVVDADEAETLNRSFRGRDYATNVLSFPFEAPPGFEDEPELGDLVICAAVVARESAEQGKSLDAHWAHMVIHGTLHLLGYDHMNEDDARIMEDREREILARFGIGDPYAAELE